MSIIEIYSQHYDCDLTRELIATIVRRDPPTEAGTKFVTDGKQPLEVARTWYRRGHRVKPHRHVHYSRKAFTGQTQEVLIIEKGRMDCEFYDYQGRYAGGYTGRPGDIIIIVGGGHSFTALEDVELIEVKQGPHTPQDKEFFGGVTEQKETVGMVARKDERSRVEDPGA